MIGKLHNAYHSITCDNGTSLVFSQVKALLKKNHILHLNATLPSENENLADLFIYL